MSSEATSQLLISKFRHGCPPALSRPVNTFLLTRVSCEPETKRVLERDIRGACVTVGGCARTPNVRVRNRDMGESGPRGKNIPKNRQRNKKHRVANFSVFSVNPRVQRVRCTNFSSPCVTLFEQMSLWCKETLAESTTKRLFLRGF